MKNHDEIQLMIGSGSANEIRGPVRKAHQQTRKPSTYDNL